MQKCLLGKWWGWLWRSNKECIVFEERVQIVLSTCYWILCPGQCVGKPNAQFQLGFLFWTECVCEIKGGGGEGYFSCLESCGKYHTGMSGWTWSIVHKAWLAENLEGILVVIWFHLDVAVWWRLLIFVAANFASVNTAQVNEEC